MIRVIRSQSAPAVLHRLGSARTAADCASRDAGDKEFDFSSYIYSHGSVRARLEDDQHGKCAYCETKLTGQAGRVDHFRPKDGVKQSEGHPLEKPGYYWMAYVWENLLLSCEKCNDQGHKGNLFPLRDPAARVSHHGGAISSELPLLIDPSAIDPKMFISFREEIAFAIDGNVEGEATIKIFRLNTDPKLVKARQIHFGRMKKFCALVQLRVGCEHKLMALDPQDPHWLLLQKLLTEIEKAQEELRESVLDSASYAAMTRAFLESNQCE